MLSFNNVTAVEKFGAELQKRWIRFKLKGESSILEKDCGYLK